MADEYRRRFDAVVLDRGSSSNPIPKIKRKGAVSTHRLNLLAAFCEFPNQIGLAASY